jgi:hypothetical protein
MAKRAEFALSTEATPMIATGNVAPVFVYDPNLPKGAPRAQERGEEGGLLWVADFLIDDGGDRANVAGVRFEAPQQPVFKKFERVNFTYLRCSVYVNQAGQLGLSYTGGLAPAAQVKQAA